MFILPIWTPIGARSTMTKRSSLWLVFLCITVMATSASTTAILLRAHFGDVNTGWVLIAIGGCTLLLFVTWTLALAERSRRIKAAARRREREEARIRRYEQEVNRAHHEAATAEMARKKRDASLLNRTVAEMIEKAKMDEPTYVLPPSVVFTRSTVEATRVSPTARRAQLLRDWLDDTGEIPWPRT